MKKAIGIFLAVLVIGLAVYFFIQNQNGESGENGSATSFIKPKIELASIVVKSMENGTINLQMNALVENEMPISFGVDTLTYNIFLEDVLVAESTHPEGISVAANDSTTISLPVTLYKDKINQVLQKVEQNQSQDSINIEMKADLHTDIPFKDDPIELSFTKKSYFVRQPQIIVKNVSVEKFGFDESEVEMTIQVNNPNQFAFTFRQTDYEFNVDNESIANGAIEKATNISAEDSSTFVVPFKVNLDEVGENVFNLLFKPGETNYEFSLSTQIESKSNIINNSTLQISRSGKLKELIN